MAKTDSGSKFVAHRVWSWRLEQLSLAYDMAWHAWSPDFRSEVEEYLARVTERHFFDHGSFTEYMGWSMGPKLGSQALAGPCIAGLVLLGQKGAAPEAPLRLLGGRDPRLAMPPLGPASGATGNLTLPKDWSITEPIRFDDGPPEIQGVEVAAPDAALMSPKGQLEFKPLGAKGLWQGRVDLTAAMKRTVGHWAWLRTEFHFSAERWVRFWDRADGGVLSRKYWWNGTPLREGDVFKVGKGRHHLMLKASIGECNPWGKITIAPQVEHLDTKLAPVLLSDLEADDADRRFAYQDDMAYVQREGGASPRYRELFAFGEGFVNLAYGHLIGEGGFQAGERDMNFVLWGLMRYAPLYQRSMGESVTPYNDIAAYLPRKLFSAVQNQEGIIEGQALNGKGDFRMNEWFENTDTTGTTLASLYPLCPPSMQAIAHEAWTRRYLRGEKGYAPLFRNFGEKRVNHPWSDLDTHPLFTAVHFPLEAPERQDLPRVWRASTYGYGAVRSGFEGPDDVVFQCFAKTRPSPRWDRENAGALRLRGFGEEFIVGSGGSDRRRFTETALLLPGRDHHLGACGALIHEELDRDGISSWTVDLSQLHHPVSKDERGRPVSPFTPLGGVRKTQPPQPELRVLRSVAVDVSGKCGAPMLVALVDTVQPEVANEWLFQLDSRTEKYGKWDIVDAKGKVMKGKAIKKARVNRRQREKLKEGYEYVIRRDPKVSEAFVPSVQADLEVGDHSFRLRRGKAFLQASFAPSENFHLKEEKVQLLQKVLTGHSHGVNRVGSWRVKVADQSRVFVVFTLQEDEAPEVLWRGQGDSLRARVGEREVSFDGLRVLIQ